MKKILFTSSVNISENIYYKFEILCIPLISTEIYPSQRIEKQFPEGENIYILTSKNSAKAIESIEISGDFYVVGKNTAKKLISQGRKIIDYADNANDLKNKIPITNKNYVFIKGNKSLSTIPDFLRNNKVKHTEIEVYQTKLMPQKIDLDFDGIVFMSPSAVESYCKMNTISSKMYIFTLGKTTALKVKEFSDKEVFYPEESTKEALFDLINQKLND